MENRLLSQTSYAKMALCLSKIGEIRGNNCEKIDFPVAFVYLHACVWRLR
jgi:hypothetical protein